MSKKSPKIAALLEGLQGRALDAHYLGFFECFNQQLFYESHDVLEELWLPVRHETKGDFYRGLIQLAGAFVHLQKNRLGPAAALFQRSRENLQRYAPAYEQLEVMNVLQLIDDWLARTKASGSNENPLNRFPAPKLELLPELDRSPPRS